MNRKSSKKSFFSKPLVLVALAILVIATTIGATVAFLTSTGSVTNTFKPATVDVFITEDFDRVTKSNVCVHVGESDIPVWLRATVVYTWVDKDDYVVPGTPSSGDYSIDFADGWVNGSDGYLYYKVPVTKGDFPDGVKLIDRCTVTAETENKLHVEILAEAIQAADTTAIKNAWPGAPVKDDLSGMIDQEEGT